MANPDRLKLSRTDFQLAMLDDAATYHGWTITEAQIMGDPARHYTKDGRSIHLSMYSAAGVAEVRIMTFGGRWHTPTTDKVAEIMAELCATEDATEWKIG